MTAACILILLWNVGTYYIMYLCVVCGVFGIRWHALFKRNCFEGRPNNWKRFETIFWMIYFYCLHFPITFSALFWNIISSRRWTPPQKYKLIFFSIEVNAIVNMFVVLFEENNDKINSSMFRGRNWIEFVFVGFPKDNGTPPLKCEFAKNSLCSQILIYIFAFDSNRIGAFFFFAVQFALYNYE